MEFGPPDIVRRPLELIVHEPALQVLGAAQVGIVADQLQLDRRARKAIDTVSGSPEPPYSAPGTRFPPQEEETGWYAFSSSVFGRFQIDQPGAVVGASQCWGYRGIAWNIS